MFKMFLFILFIATCFGLSDGHPQANSTKYLKKLYSSPSVIRRFKSRRMRWAGHVARMGAKRNAYRLLVGKPEGKRPLGRPRRRWVNNIRMDLGEMGRGDVDWIGLAQDRNSVLNLRVP
jgi:hypothetical protein